MEKRLKQKLINLIKVDVIKNPLQAQQSIGYLPEHNPLYLEMYVKEYLSFRAQVFKVKLIKMK